MAAFRFNLTGCYNSNITAPTSSTQPTTPSIHETALNVNSMSNSSAPGNHDFNPKANSSALPSVASGNHETILGVNSMANSSDLPSESQVAPGNHETALGVSNSSSLPSESMVASNHGTAFSVDSMANSSALPSTGKSIAAPMPGAAKKNSKMRPGMTNTARYELCDCG